MVHRGRATSLHKGRTTRRHRVRSTGSSTAAEKTELTEPSQILRQRGVEVPRYLKEAPSNKNIMDRTIWRSPDDNERSSSGRFTSCQEKT